MSSGNAHHAHQKPTHTEKMAAFFEKLTQQEQDILALDMEQAWRMVYPEEAIPRGLALRWQREQVRVAARRSLLVAGLLLLPVTTEHDRRAFRDRVLMYDDQVADPSLVQWLRTVRSRQLSQFWEACEQAHGEANVEGYQAIARESERLGWPTHYREDLTTHDRTQLCVAGAPRTFWWGVRSTGTDLYIPGTLGDVRWARAARPYEESRHFYRYTPARGLQACPLDAVIAGLLRSLDVQEYEQRWREAQASLQQAKAECTRIPTRETILAHRVALEQAERAEQEYREVASLRRHRGGERERVCDEETV